MTILGGRSRRKLRGVTLVVTHEDAWTTEWLIRQIVAGVHNAQGESCPISIFVLADDNVSQQIVNSDEHYEIVPRDSKVWIPRVLAALREADAVVVSGIETNKVFANNLKANLLYLPVLVDSFELSPHFLPGHAADLNRIARAAKTIFFNSELARSTAEYVAPAMSERTRVLRPGSFKLKQKYNLTEVVPSVIQPVSGMTPAVQEFFESLHEFYREMQNPPKTVITGSECDEKFFLDGEYGDIRFLPGIEFHSTGDEKLDVGPSITIVDDVSFDDRLVEWSMKESIQLGAFPLSLSKIEKQSLVNVLTGNASLPTEEWAFSIPPTHGITLKKGIHQALRPNELMPGRETKVVLAGSDFKFASALIKELDAASDIRFVVDRVANNSIVSRGRSIALAEWADVVVTEFLNEQAVWYSNNLPSRKRLIVHMHGFELYGSFADRVNLDGVDQIVVPSDGYKAKVVELRGWPESKITVIHNSGSLNDLDRPKSDQAKFTLGLVGWVPSLKRIDRAFDLLEKLIDVDDRYVLEVRGAPPWDYTWEWNTPAHRDTYIEILRRLKSNPRLAEHVTFSPFGPDVGNWLRGIGWMLSPSFRESFHLAPVEGMLSGAIPVVWQREGATDIFGSEWVVENTAAAVQRILATGSQEDGWERLSHRSATYAAERYSDTISRGQWHEIIVNVENLNSRKKEAEHREAVTPECIRSVQLTEHGAFLEAWEEIQRNGNLALEVSREYGLSHSAWVRGHIRLPNKLLALQHRARQQEKNAPVDEKSILVQVAALGRETPRDNHGAVSIVLLKPPAGSPEAAKYIPSYFTNFQPMVRILGPEPSKAVTLEEHIEVIAEQLVQEANRTQSYNFRVDGPYWAVIAALYAAVEVAGTVDWDLSQHTTLNYAFFRPNSNVVTDDPLELSAIVLSQMVRRVLIREGAEIPSGTFEMFDAQSIVPVTHTYKTVKVLELETLPSDATEQELPRVSIILPSYRIDGSLLRTLESIYHQTYPLEKLEVQIVLNGQGVANRQVVERFARHHRGPEWRILESGPGVVAARNCGLADATGEYITFVDDDDLVERNYVAALVAMAASDTVVAADMVDVDENDSYTRDTNAVRRVKALGYEQVPAYTRAGLFGACGGKLIPTDLIGEHRFDPTLSSGEDVAFLGAIVAQEQVGLVAAHRIGGAAYVRTVSNDSVSRPQKITVQFGVRDRLRVSYLLWIGIRGCNNDRLISAIEQTLIRPQINLLLQATDSRPDFHGHIRDELQNYDDDFVAFLENKYQMAA